MRVGARTEEIDSALAKLGTNAKRLDGDFKKLGNTPIAQAAKKSFDELQGTIKNITDAQQRLADRSQLAAKGIDALGGPARLTRSELDQMAKTIERGLDAFRALGQQAPRELQKVSAAVHAQQRALADLAKPSVIGQIGANIATTAAGFVTGQAIIGGLQAVADAFVQATKGSIEFASHLDDLSKSTNIGVEALQELGFAGKRVGLDLDSVAGLVGQLAKRLGTGDEGAVGAIQALGLNFQQLKGLAPDLLFQTVAEAVARIQDPLQQAAIGSQLFGKQFESAIRLANDGLTQTRQAARDAGAVLGKEAIANLDAFGDKVGDIALSLKVLTAEGVTPLISELHQLFTETGNISSFFGLLKSGVEVALEPITRSIRLLRLLQATIGRGGPAEQPPVEQPFVGPQQAGAQLITNAELIANRLKALRAGALEPLTAAQRANIASLKEWGVSEKEIADLVGVSQAAVHRYADALNKSKAAQDKFNEAMVELTAASGGFGTIIDGIAGDTQEAVKFFLKAGVSQSVLATAFGLSAVEVKALATQMEVLAKITDLEIGATEGLAEGLGKIGKAEVELLPQLKARLDVLEKIQKLEEVRPGQITVEALPGADVESLGRLKASLEQAQKFGKEVDSLAAAFAQLAQVSGDTFGGIVRDIGIVLNAFSLARKAVEAFAAAETKAGKLAALVSGAGALAAATGTGSPGSAIAGGAVVGAQLGEAIAGPIGAAIGAAAGAILGAIRSIFHKPEWKKLQHDIGRDLGVGISDALAQSLEVDSKKFGRQVTESLHLDEIINAAGGIGDFGIDKAIARVRDLFTFLDQGRLTVNQVGQEFDKVFAQLLPEAVEKGTGLASAALVDLIVLAKEKGLKSENLDKFIQDQLGGVITGLQAALKTGPLAGQGAATGFGAAIAAAFAGLQERGVPILQIFKQLQPLLVAFEQKLKAAGLSGGAAFDQIARLGGIAKQFAPALDGVDGIRQALAGLANTGLLSQEAFAGLAAQVGATFDRLTAKGVSGDDALKLMQPTLQTLFELQERFGVSVDAATQKLIDQAKAAGLIGDQFKGPQERMIDGLTRIADILTAIAQKLGADIPNAAQSAATAISGNLGTAAGNLPADLSGAAQAGVDQATRIIGSGFVVEINGQLVQVGQGLKDGLATGAKVGSDLVSSEMDRLIKLVNDKIASGDIKTLTVPVDVNLPTGGFRISPNEVPKFPDTTGPLVTGLQTLDGTIGQVTTSLGTFASVATTTATESGAAFTQISSQVAGAFTGAAAQAEADVKQAAFTSSLAFQPVEAAASHAAQTMTSVFGAVPPTVTAEFHLDGDLHTIFARLVTDAEDAAGKVTDAISDIAPAGGVTIPIKLTLQGGVDLSRIQTLFSRQVFGSTGGVVTTSGIQHFAAGGTVRPVVGRPDEDRRRVHPFADGGRVIAFPSRMGTDTVPAMLTPGEVVLTQAQQRVLIETMGQAPPLGGRSAQVIRSLFGSRAVSAGTSIQRGDRIQSFASGGIVHSLRQSLTQIFGGAHVHAEDALTLAETSHHLSVWSPASWTEVVRQQISSSVGGPVDRSISDTIQHFAQGGQVLNGVSGQESGSGQVVALPLTVHLEAPPIDHTPHRVLPFVKDESLFALRNIQYFASGGTVLPFLRRGSDTVPAMLTPGEVVLNRRQQEELRSSIGGSVHVAVDARGAWFDGRGVEELAKRLTEELGAGRSFSKFKTLVQRVG